MGKRLSGKRLYAFGFPIPPADFFFSYNNMVRMLCF